MAVFANQPGDLQYLVQYATDPSYVGEAAAIVAAIALSAANANASVLIARFVNATTGGVAASNLLATDLEVGAGVPLYMIALMPATTYYPLEVAEQAADALAISDGGVAPVVVARVQTTLTAA
ncbi:MAG: hypothetical protein NVS1B2_15980 [Vulcanimicrobiaceae bacterium]